MTVAGNLKDMFARLVAANDLEFRTGADSPTLRIDDLTVAGREARQSRTAPVPAVGLAANGLAVLNIKPL